LVRLTALDGKVERHEGRIKELEKRQDDLGAIVNAVSVMKADQDHIKCDVGEIKAKVNDLSSKPSKRWDLLVEEVIKLLLAGVIGFAVSKLF